jgi:hypothetical protein
MERVRIKELQLKFRNTKNKRVTNNAIAEEVFADDVLDRKGREGEELSESRKRSLVSEWDNGKSLSSFKPRHLLRLADLFKTYDVRELIQHDKRK